MKGMFKRRYNQISNFLFESGRPIQLILFNMMLIACAVVGVITIIVSLFTNQLLYQNLIICAAEILIIFSYRLANKKGCIKAASIALVSIISFAIFPVLFFAGGGLNSGMSVWFTIELVFTFLIIDGIASYILLVLQMASIAFIYYVGYKHPELVTEISSEVYVIIDIVQGIFLVGIIIGIINKIQNRIHGGVITKMEEQKKALIESEEKADAANHAKSDFLSNMSHEIRTPINAILGMNEMILRESHDKKIIEYATAVQNSSKALLSLINDVLDISKIEAGKIEITNVDYKLADLVCDCFSLVQPRLEKKGLAATMFCDSDLPAGLTGDEVRIRQIVVNFLTNAAKYTEKGKVDFNVNGSIVGNEVTITFSVKDTGIGLKDEDKEKLFGKFERFDMKKNRNVEGTGLGLNLSKQLAELMGGGIEVKSVYGLGSEFIFTIPQKVWDMNPVGEVSVAKRNEKEIKIYHQSFEAPEAKILAVDDVDMNLIVLENLLKETKMEIDLSESGADALKKASRKKYDLIFMDHMMPELNGIQTLEKLREMTDSPNHDTPVIVLTANALAGVRKEYIEKGFKDYVSKPINGDTIEQVLIKYLPPEKVHLHTPEDDEPKCKGLVALKELLPEFDHDTALSYCDGSEDLCLEIIEDWCAENRVDSMRMTFISEDWDNYRLHVHSVKGSTRTVGLPVLAEKFRQLENAAKIGDSDYIKSHHEEVLNNYINCLDKMKEAGLCKKAFD